MTLFAAWRLDSALQVAVWLTCGQTAAAAVARFPISVRNCISWAVLLGS
jgi:hypothetical protein